MRKKFLFAVTAVTMIAAMSTSFFVKADTKEGVNIPAKNVIVIEKATLAQQLDKLLPSIDICWKNGRLNHCMIWLIECINKPGTGIPDTNEPETEEVTTGGINIDEPETEEPVTSRPGNDVPETDEIVTTKPQINVPTTEETTTKKVENNVPETEKPSVNIPETTSKPVQDNQSLSYAEQVVKLVNKERAKAGLKELVLDKSIQNAALVRAKEIEISFSHTRPNGSSFSSVLKEYGISYRGSGENIAWGQRSPEEVMKGWMNSEGHRANILNPKFTKIGVGYYRNSSGRNYWTQLFTY